MTINGDTPSIDPSTGGYAYTYMKSNAEITFGYTSTSTSTLEADWVLDGPTDWNGASMASGTSHTDVMSPTTTFCKVDLSSATNCQQGATWNVKLYLHDNEGHSRVLSATVMTDDTKADAYAPNASVEIEMRDSYAERIESQGVKTASGVDWPQNRIHLDETGSLTVYFDASESNDPDAVSGNGIETYEWTAVSYTHLTLPTKRIV